MPDELFDIVDENNVVIGQEWRSVVHQRGLWHRGVHVFLFTRDGKLLVQQRSKNRDTFPSALDCSVSEHLKAGENYWQAAVRGLQEELGLAGIDLDLLVEFGMNYGPNDNEFCQLYQGIVNPAHVRFDPGEVERVMYYTMSDLLALLRERRAVACYWFEQIVSWYLGKPSALGVLRTSSSSIRVIRPGESPNCEN
jgi:isopentenyldiphosphate isomerase